MTPAAPTCDSAPLMRHTMCGTLPFAFRRKRLGHCELGPTLRRRLRFSARRITALTVNCCFAWLLRHLQLRVPDTSPLLCVALQLRCLWLQIRWIRIRVREWAPVSRTRCSFDNSPLAKTCTRLRAHTNERGTQCYPGSCAAGVPSTVTDGEPSKSTAGSCRDMPLLLGTRPLRVDHIPNAPGLEPAFVQRCVASCFRTLGLGRCLSCRTSHPCSVR
jgi:hypothetical protein